MGEKSAAMRMRELFDSPDRGRVFNVIAAECGRAEDDAWIAAMIDVFRTHRPRIELLPDARAALHRLRATHRLGIITDGYAAVQRRKIDALAVAALVDEIIVTDDWGREFWKPHPRAYIEIAARLDVAAPDCTYVADNPGKDFAAPNNLGWNTVFVRRAGGVYAGVTAAEGGTPMRVIGTLDEL